MITVMGATGQVGGAIARQLLAAGEEVRAIGRSAAALAELAAAGAHPLMGDAGEVDFLSRAFAAADAVFTMLPFDPSAPDYRAHQTRLGEAIAEAIQGAGVRRVVALSSIGADVPAGTGVLTALYAQEQRLAALAEVHLLALRPGSFFENFLAAVDAIEHEGGYADIFAPDIPMPMIAVRDVATGAADALRRRDWHGHLVREMPGPRDLSYAEATRILGARLGRPNADYLQLPEDETATVLAGYGFSPDAARHYVEFAQALASGVVRARHGRPAGAQAGTRFEEFTAGLVAAAKPA
jgi:uncharacterized protein YbjT (DUF2867 family)